MPAAILRLSRLALASTALTLVAPALAEPVPTATSILGHEPGDDRYLANYEDSIRYFEALAKASDRIKLVTSGKTTEGRTFTYAIISSPENVRNFQRYADISRRLGDPRGLTDAQAKQLAADSKIIVHIDGGMHASEVADHQLPLALAYKLLSAKDDAEVDRILNDVILVLWPTLNPDGQDMVVKWYRDHVGTPYETSRMPWLYQEYVGHDNNRDGYMLNMIESRVVNREEQTYSPVIWYSQHQTAPFPARIWVPPFADPVSSNISPYMRIWTNAIGTNMMTRFEKEQKPGAIAQARFDNWYPGFLDYIHVFRNTISFFTETAHDSATPKTYALADFPKPMRDLKAQIMYPNPWRGGEWHLKDSVDYMVTASMSVLDTAQKYREELLYNRYQAGRDTIRRYAADGPSAYVIPAGQTDMTEAASLAQLMIDHGLDVHQLRAPATIGGTGYAAGSFVIPTAQPFAGLTTELLEPQKYPDAILDGTGKPVDLPYDVTGWTLPMQMGVRVDRITAPFDPAVAVKVAKAEAPAGTVVGTGNTFLLDRRVNAAYRTLNQALALGAKARVAADDRVALSGLTPAQATKLAADNRVTLVAASAPPAGAGAVQKGRVALYRPWGSNIDEGWTRWLLEQYDFAPTSLYNADVKKGGLSRFDTIVLPDIAPQRAPAAATTDAVPPGTPPRSGSVVSLLNGLNAKDYPAPYAGGIGDDGAEQLKRFVRDGGTLVALNNASDAVIDLFDLPVTNVLKNASSDTFFCSGALLAVEMTPGTRATAGMPADPIVMFERGPAFAPKPGFEGRILAAYPKTGNPLRSGVLLHPEAIQGKAAAMEVRYGKGTIYLYGFKPQWRAQSHGTYKLLFNPLYRG
ncbi:M14 metallopeptidase family protein [Sphingomonas sp. VNH70]|uniref:M14 family metallopeptidase n=1 Tax=Sphingomonas silueang TaxID=3156617 RepID=UPI0032B52139